MNETNQTNLHSVWDSDLLEYRLHQDFQSNIDLYFNHIFLLMLNQSTSNNDDDFKQWIRESTDIVCSQIYFDDNNMTLSSSINFTLGEIYYNRNLPLVEQRLAQAGRRLGSLLNRLANNRPPSTSNKKDKLCGGSIALIVVLLTEAIIGLIVILGVHLHIRSRNKERLH